LTSSDALAIVIAWVCILHIGRVDGWGFFFNLQKERVVRAIAFEVDAVIAQADLTGSDNFECDVNRPVEGEQVLTLRFEGLPVWGEGVEYFFGLLPCDAREAGFDFFEAT